jgi:hypothetical protein
MTTFNYIGLGEVKKALGIALTDTDDDELLSLAIGAACEVVNNYCGRRFNLESATRYYAAEYEDVLYIPDLVSVTTLKTDEGGDGTFERTWQTTDFLLYPYGSLEVDRPYGKITRAPDGDYLFPTGARLVQIVGTFGFSEVPEAVRWATLQQAIRFYKRKDAPFGVTGSAEMGQLLVIPTLEPDVRMALAGYRAGPWIV